MGKVDCFEIAGLEAYFYSSDHPPQHFHVRKPDKYEIKVFILDCTEKALVFEVVWGRTEPSSAEKQDILMHVLANREELLEEWKRKVCPR